MKSRKSTWFWRLIKIAIFVGIFAGMAGAGSLCFYQFGSPEQTCLSCHEIQHPYDVWKTSAHREISCKGCHGGAMTSGIHGIKENLNRVVAHFRDVHHDNMGLSETQVVEMTARCKACHAQEFIQWRDGGHGVLYKDIFLNEKHNHIEQVNEECLRCHGMFFKGKAADLVTPLDIKGPWQMKDTTVANRPAIPCLACHQLHAPGHPFSKTAAQVQVADAGAAKDPQREEGIAIYSRRENMYFPMIDLPSPAMQDHGKPVAVSPDPRQRLCTQCHAPNAFRQVGASDDRTPVGVHEGLSCAACHSPHSNDATASCAQCHPKFSHCGIDVMKMDTSFLSHHSSHNIHSVRCTDCHPSGVPPKAAAATAQDKP